MNPSERRRDSVASFRHPWMGALLRPVRAEAPSGACREGGADATTGRHPMKRSEIGMSPGGPTRSGEGEKGCNPGAYAKSACEADALKRRRRDSNPRDVAAQQFSRLPPSTTRPHLRKVDKGKNFVRKINPPSKRISTGTGSGRSRLP